MQCPASFWSCFGTDVPSDDNDPHSHPIPSTLPVTRAVTNRPSTESTQPLRPNTGSPKLLDSRLWQALASQDRPAGVMSTTLERKLLEAEVEWPPGQNRYFIPVDTLNALMTKDELARELRTIYPQMGDSQISSYVASICETAKKLVAVLLCIGKSKYICAFLDEGLSDADLPFVRSYPTSPFDLCRASHEGSPGCLKQSHKDCGIRAMVGWSQRDIQVLCRDQWLVQAPVFESIPGKILHIDLNDNVILPYIEDHEGLQDFTSARGGYSHVWGIRMHSAHQKVYKSADERIKEPLLAIKRPFSRDIIDFRKETEMLSALAVRNHPHLIKLLATYKFKNHYHLVFPFANTNLRGYWEDTGLPHWNAETYTWALRQLRGLTSGLNAIHNFRGTHAYGTEPAHRGLTIPVAEYLTVETSEEKFGRHGDIKPENILWSNELGTGKEGVLQIADMGLGRFHGVDSRSRVDARTVSCSPTYAPPEVILQQAVSRAYDIWSMGCVFLEFATWLLEGHSVLKDFSTARGEVGLDGVNDDTFYTVVNQGDGSQTAIVREGVVSWIDRLRRNERCSDMVRELLKIIQTRMLVIESKRRIRSEELDAELRAMRIKSEESLVYLLGSNAPSADQSLGIKLPHGPKTRYAPPSMLNTNILPHQDGETPPVNILETPTLILPGEEFPHGSAARPLSRTPFPV